MIKEKIKDFISVGCTPNDSSRGGVQLFAFHFFQLQKVTNVTFQITTQRRNSISRILAQRVIRKAANGVFAYARRLHNLSQADRAAFALAFLTQKNKQLTSHNFHASLYTALLKITQTYCTLHCNTTQDLALPFKVWYTVLTEFYAVLHCKDKHTMARRTKTLTPRQPDAHGPDVIYNGNDFDIFVDGCYLGSRTNSQDAWIEARRVYFDAIEQSAIQTADMLAGVA